MFVYMPILVLIFILNQKLNLFHERSTDRIIARSIVISFFWPVLLPIFILFILFIYIFELFDKLTDLLTDFLNEVS